MEWGKDDGRYSSIKYVFEQIAIESYIYETDFTLGHSQKYHFYVLL